VLTYLRDLFREWSTWACLAVVIACVLVFWYYRGQIYTHVVGTLALFGAALKDEMFKRTLEWFRSLFTRPAVSAPSKEVSMFEVQSLIAGALQQVESTAFSVVMDQIGASELVPEGKQLVADFSALRASPSFNADLKFVGDLSQVIHDLSTKLSAANATIASQPPSPSPTEEPAS